MTMGLRRVTAPVLPLSMLQIHYPAVRDSSRPAGAEVVAIGSPSHGAIGGDCAVLVSGLAQGGN